jgi:lipoyl(octanoyl) transferase
MTLHLNSLGQADYLTTWHAMRDFTLQRTEDTPDECWLVEHPPVFTLGLAGNPAHLLAVPHAQTIPCIQTDRGGQITYHGLGQIVLYPLLDLRRYNLKVREYVVLIEQIVIDYLAELSIIATRKTGAPGVYVGESKIAALGIKVHRGCTYHGLALNVNNNLTPFSWINPCGYAGLQTTSLAQMGITSVTPHAAGLQLFEHLQAALLKQTINHPN